MPWSENFELGDSCRAAFLRHQKCETNVACMGSVVGPIAATDTSAPFRVGSKPLRADCCELVQYLATLPFQYGFFLSI